MELKPIPLKRGDHVENMEGNIIGAIGGFSKACIGHHHLNEALEVLLIQGSAVDGFYARLGDAHHCVYEGILKESEVSFTLEAFKTDLSRDVLKNLKKASQAFQFVAKGDVREAVIEFAEKQKIRGGLLYVRGKTSHLKVYDHTDSVNLSDETKTFDEVNHVVGVEGWGNLSFIDGKDPFVHVHGTYEGHGKKKGGHFIMDGKTLMSAEELEILICPVAPLVRTKQQEDFPTWEIR